MMRRTVCAAVSFLALTACAAPTTSVTTVDTRPRIQLVNVLPTETLSVDGAEMGDASSFSAPNKVLALDHGTHLIQVRNADQLIFSQTIYLGEDMTKTIELPELK